MHDQLAGRTIFITGAGGLLGSTYVTRMLAAGARVAATDLPGPRAEALVAAHQGHSGFRFYELDVNDEAQVEQAFERIRSDGWKPDVVLNNAAITGEMLLGAGGDFPGLAHTSLNDWNRLIARQMDRDIVGRYPTTLINVASMYALNGPHHRIYEDMPFGSLPGYSATKAGVHGLTLWLAGYWASRQATVNTLAPGAVFNGHSDEFRRRVGELVMAGRMADPDEIANVMLFLCSAQAGYMTGQLVNVDGGFSGW